jgi:uncharacterized membrane protein
MMNSCVTLISRRQFREYAVSRETRSILWVIVVSVVVATPAIFFGIPWGRDLPSHFRFALPFYDSIRSGHLYPGWLAESNLGYGDPSFRFYPPALYYLLALTRTVTGNWYSASLAAFAVLFVTGGLGIYLWAREFVASQTAMWAGILYAVAPYHLNQIYQAFMLAEFAAAAVLPFVFAFAERVCTRRRSQDVSGLAASYALLVLTHLPMGVIGSIALLAYILLRVETENRWKTLRCLAVSLTLGLAASACFWTTVLFELSWIRADSIKPDPAVDYRNNFVLSTLSADNLNVWWTNILLLATAAMFWPGVAAFRCSTGSVARKVKAIGILAIFTVFMATPLSRPIWNLFHPLQATQFPWRWLAITSLVCPIAFASAIPFWARKWRERKRPLALIVTGTMAISIVFSAMQIVRSARFLDVAQFQETLRSTGSEGISHWWPVWVKEPFKPMNVQVEAGQRAVRVRSWEPERRVFDVGPGDAQEVRVRAFYYPYWMATFGDKELHVRPDADGAALISIPRGETSVILEFSEPSRVRWAALATALGWIAITMLGVFNGRRRVESLLA